MWQLIEFFLAIIGALFLASAVFLLIIVACREWLDHKQQDSSTPHESDIEKIWGPQNGRNE